MIKLLITTAGLAVTLAGCATALNIEQQGSPVEVGSSATETPIQSLVAEHLLTLGQKEVYPRSTELRAERIPVTESDTAAQMKVWIVEDGIADDAVKKTEREVHLRQQQDGSWKVIKQELLHVECYRGKVDNTCL